MPTFESIINEGDFVSEHFLTTDGKASFATRVVARTKEWREADSSPVTRFTAARGEIESLLLKLSEDAADADSSSALHARLLEVLGYSGAGYALTATDNVTLVGSPGLSGAAPLAIVSARPADALEDIRDKERPGLWSPFEATDGKDSYSLPGFVSTLFAREDAPSYALVLAGRWALLTEAARWAEGRVIAVDLQLVAERNDAKRGGEIETALTILSADSLAPNAEGDVWWSEVLEGSIKHTVGVSKDLREGVRLSIEIIANDVVRRREAQSLEPLPPAEAQVLAVQSLRYLYRILFLLYAEASPELGVLPTGTPEYDAGYSLDRLRELVLTEITSDDAASKTHLYDSLGVLFTLVDQGHSSLGKASDRTDDALTFRSLSADLFQPSAIAHISDVKLSDSALKDVLERLLLSKKESKRERGFISYAELGINQLGAVYEGLMSYTGFFAQEDLFEVAKNGDSSKGSWVVPVTRAEGIDAKDFVSIEDTDTGEDKPVIHPEGTFVYRLAGRERQQSASFYTPEVLTRFTVGQALEELLDQEGETTTAEQVLELTVCEPALGSGAFAIEASRQLAAEYLARRQKETGETIPPEDYQRELQRVKAYIALHNVYGVDLNGTAVELAEISLWLDTMVEGLEAPWFGLHLRRGNSLIGARRAVYSRDAVRTGAALKNPPTNVPVAELLDNADAGTIAGQVSGQIFHFLIPAEGWGAAADAKEAEALAPEATLALKEWRRSIRRKPTKKQLDDLQELTYRVEALWQMAAKRLTMANEQARRSLDVWGRDADEVTSVVTRAQIEEFLADEDSAYRRLRTVMDAWCALWFWPVESAETPPTLDEWIATLFDLLGRAPEARSRSRMGADTLAGADDWDALGDSERTDFGLAGAISTAAVVAKHPWLSVARTTTADQGFFHWHLEFTQVFGAGGFDLQVGNPPWVRPDWDEASSLGEFDVRWVLETKIPTAQVGPLREATLELPGASKAYLADLGAIVGLRVFVARASNYPVLKGLRPDLYRCFMWQTWQHMATRGAIALIHPDTHLTDEKVGELRAETYSRLTRHWGFHNALTLFEVDSHVHFGVHTYGASGQVNFMNASGLYHPDTAQRSIVHDGSGQEPGLKDDENKWDLRPHSSRIIRVDSDVLLTWHSVLESNEVPVLQTRMLYTVNRSVARVLDKLAAAPRLGDMELEFSQGWNETTDFNKGYFSKSWGAPNSWEKVILQGPHIHVSNPAYKIPNETMLHNQDWSPVDLESLPEDYIPVTSYKPAGDRAKYVSDYTHWGKGEKRTSARDHYRIAWRAMAASTGERTLIPAIIPPGAAHIHGVIAFALPTGATSQLAGSSGSMSSLLADLLVRNGSGNNVRASIVRKLPRLEGTVADRVAANALRLECVTRAHADLWRLASPSAEEWSWSTPARRARARRQLQVEIDALVALSLGVTADELCTVYRTQFAVLRKYDQQNHYDANGRLVPGEVLKRYETKGESLTADERTATHPGSGVEYTYEFPFQVLDREADMRAAYAQFELEFGDDL